MKITPDERWPEDEWEGEDAEEDAAEDAEDAEDAEEEETANEASSAVLDAVNNWAREPQS